MKRRRSGRAGDLDIWLIHGLGDSPRVWRDVRKQPALAGHRVLVPALPGHGGARPLPKRSRNVRGLARWLEAQIRRRSQGHHVVLVGHSMGGMIGTLVATQMPELRGLINIEGPLTLADLETARKGAAAKNFADWFQGFRRRVNAPGGAPPHYPLSLDEADVSTFHGCANDIVALARRDRIGKIYARLRVPAIFFYGSADGQSKRSVDFLRSHGCKIKAFAGAAHWPMCETPAQFERAFARSIASLGKGARRS